MELIAEEARLIAWEDHERAEIVRNLLIDRNRWSHIYELIFKWDDGRFYRTVYTVGATEAQSERPFESHTHVKFTEVVPYEKTVVDYKEVGSD